MAVQEVKNFYVEGSRIIVPLVHVYLLVIDARYCVLHIYGSLLMDSWTMYFFISKCSINRVLG